MTGCLSEIRMFTGIIKNQGKVLKKESKGGQIHFAFGLKKPEKLNLGESIAINGVCLTAAKSGPKSFECDVMNETLNATTLGSIQLRDSVNLERSLKAGDEIGGHFVTGHVDGTGIIEKIINQGKNKMLWIKAGNEVIKSLAAKGSVAVDGISLTVQAVEAKSFKVGIVPHTFKETNLKNIHEGQKVNLEIDLITRYLKVLNHELPVSGKSGMTVKYLKRQGF